MIKVKITYVDNKFQSLKVSGHAKSAEYGKDLVCAEVSAVVTGGFNALEDIDNFEVKLEEGLAYLERKGTISAHDEVVIATIISGLKTIEEANEKFIKIL
ncbi:MAG: ribosomal-processing cysteine protease Prp [Bacilli bacterium]|nr:ribosomal-processing cysteine protease Prp [Bacilli bacterium]